MAHDITIFVTAFSAASLATAQPAIVQSAASKTLLELSTKAGEARLKGDVPTWLSFATRTLALTPDHPDILLSVARANAAAGNKIPALEHLEQAVRRGLGIDPERLAEFEPLRGDPHFKEIAVQARRNLLPVARATTFADLSNRLSEGIAYDPVSQRFFTGTEQGELLAIDLDGRVSTFVSDGDLRQVLGVKVDAGRRLLWLAHGRYPQPGPDQPADVGTGGVRAYSLDTGALVTAAELDERPVLHGFNDIALAADGTVYVTDTPRQAVYMLAPGAKRLELLLRDSGMTSPNGIVLSGDARTLYVAHVEGISSLDLATKSRRLLPVPADGSVNSIDGLLLHHEVFYGVQSSPYLNRVVAAVLSPDGAAFARVWTVSSRTPAEYRQTTAAIAGDDLYMIGGTPVPDLYGGTNTAKPVRKIWRVPLKR